MLKKGRAYQKDILSEFRPSDLTPQFDEFTLKKKLELQSLPFTLFNFTKYQTRQTSQHPTLITSFSYYCFVLLFRFCTYVLFSYKPRLITITSLPELFNQNLHSFTATVHSLTSTQGYQLTALMTEQCFVKRFKSTDTLRSPKEK